MKKLLIVTDTWHPQVNGVITVFDQIKKRLEAKGMEVIIAHPGLCWTIPFPKDAELRIGIFSGRIIKHLINTEKPDYIHIATEGSLGFSARAICLKQKLRFTSSYHTHLQLYIKARFNALENPAYALMRRFHKKAVRTLVPTESLKKTLESHGFENLFMWPLGVDTVRFTNETPSPLPPLPKPVFTYLGRLAPEKNIEDFLKLDLPGTKLVIGDGLERERFESLYGKQAMFVGYKKSRELVDWLLLSDVLVFPSQTETFGLVALEAMACGIPVAGYNAQGLSDIVTNGVDGVLDDDLKKAALGCLNIDRSNCRKKALSYSWEASVEAFLANLVSANLSDDSDSMA